MIDLIKMLDTNRVGDNSKILTPIKIAKEMVDSLPKEVWNSETVFIDPACKSGVYLAYIRDKLMECQELIDMFPTELDRLHYILTKQLFGIALDYPTKILSERYVNYQIGVYNNIIYIDNYIAKVKDKNTNFRKLIITEFQKHNKEIKEDMTFDVVIGNPPYQQTTSSINSKGGGKQVGKQSMINLY